MLKAFVTHGIEQHVLAASEGVEGIRADVPQSGDMRDFIAPLVTSPVPEFCFILHDIARNQVLLDAMRDTGFDTRRAYIEPFNEREQGRVTPSIMVDAINALFHDCDARGYEGRIVCSGDSNLNKDLFSKDDALDFYRAVVPRLPARCIVACHDYPWRDQLHYLPWPPHRTHDQELEEFLAICKGHDTACSEFGFHMAEELVGSHRVRLSQQDVKDRLIEYYRRYDRHGLLFAAAYQWGDGTTDDAMGRYGLHDIDNVPKLQAAAVREWRMAA